MTEMTEVGAMMVKSWYCREHSPSVALQDCYFDLAVGHSQGRLEVLVRWEAGG